MQKTSISSNNPRRSFLTKLAGVMGVSFLAAPAELQAAGSSIPVPDDWLGKLNGKHKMVFDVTQPHGIFPFAWPKVFLLTNQATGTPEKESNSVVVLRHDGIPYALEDRLWAKYKFGEAFGIDDHRTGKPALRNPFWQPKDGEFKVPGIGPVPIGINELQNSGVIFCVCDMALTVKSYGIAGKMNLDGAEVKKDFVSGILPGVNLVPSGLWAIGRAQEKGCGYCFAS
jgi:intracellular sulfur oxidation DsrE/DsrF family protein